MAWKRGCIDLFTDWQFKIRTGIFQRVYLLCQKLFIVIPDYRSTTAKTTLTITFLMPYMLKDPSKHTLLCSVNIANGFTHFISLPCLQKTKFKLNMSQLKNIKLLFKNNIVQHKIQMFIISKGSTLISSK